MDWWIVQCVLGPLFISIEGLLYALGAILGFGLHMITFCMDFVFYIYDKIVDKKEINMAACQCYSHNPPDWNDRYRIITKPPFQINTQYPLYWPERSYDIPEDGNYTILEDADGKGYDTEKEAWAAYLKRYGIKS